MALWVENEARRANRNLFLFNGLIVAVLVLIIADKLPLLRELSARLPAGFKHGAGRHHLA